MDNNNNTTCPVSVLGLNRVTDGPPVPKDLNIKWPESMSKMMKEQWPGVPIPREWGEQVMHYVPLGIGDEVVKIINCMGM